MYTIHIYSEMYMQNVIDPFILAQMRRNEQNDICIFVVSGLTVIVEDKTQPIKTVLY